jgi:hypothetical protein
VRASSPSPGGAGAGGDDGLAVPVVGVPVAVALVEAVLVASAVTRLDVGVGPAVVAVAVGDDVASTVVASAADGRMPWVVRTAPVVTRHASRRRGPGGRAQPVRCRREVGAVISRVDRVNAKG